MQRYEKISHAVQWLQSWPSCRLVRMTGSGACCFAVVNATAQLPQPETWPAGMRVWKVTTLAQHPLAEW
jgi:4-diphosphocytidyl-2C-methyl-D-erythritol kinase